MKLCGESLLTRLLVLCIHFDDILYHVFDRMHTSLYPINIVLTGLIASKLKHGTAIDSCHDVPWEQTRVFPTNIRR